jgi:hypothetical protein
MSGAAGLRRLGILGMLLPIAGCTAIFLIATMVFDRPAVAWLVLSMVFGTVWYWVLWVAMRRIDALEGGANADMRPQRRSSRGILLSPGGAIAAGLGVWQLAQGERAVGLGLTVVGVTMIAMRLGLRAALERRRAAKR